MNLNRRFCFLFIFFISINCFGIEQSENIKVKKFDSPIESVCWSPDGTFYITTEGNKLLFWDSKTDEVVRSKSDYDASVLSVKISDDSSSVAVVYNDNTFEVFGLQNNQYYTHQRGIGEIPIFDTVFIDNYYTLLIPLDGQNIYKFFCLLTTNDSIIKSDVIPIDSYVFGLDIDNKNKKLLVTSSDGKTHIIDTGTKKEIRSVDGYDEVSILSKFNTDGKYFLFASNEYTVNIQSVDGKEEYTIVNYDKPVNAADFSPDGKSIAIADKRGFVKIYDIKQGFVKDILKLDDGDFAFSCEFSPDGQYLIVGTREGNFIKWKPEYQKVAVGNGSGNGGGNGKGAGDGSGDEQVFVIGSQDGIKGQANIFNTDKAKKIVDLASHNIFATVGAGSINSKNYVCNLKIKAGYHNFKFYPFYWGGGLGFDLGFTDPELPYKYKVNGKPVKGPLLLGFAPVAKGGFHYLFDKIGLLAFAELGMGANIRMLTLGGYLGSPAISFFTEIGIGAQWKFLRAEFDVQIDTNFIYSVNGTIGCSFKIVPPKKKSKGVKK